MDSTTLYRLSGYASLIASLAYLSDTALDFLLPGNPFGVGILVSLFALFGLNGIFLKHREQGGWFDLIAYLVNHLGLTALVGIVFVNNFIFPVLQPDVVKSIMSGPALGLFIAIGTTYLVGAILFGLSVWLRKVFSRPAALLYMAGSIPVALPPLFPENIVSLGGVLIAIALMWWGYELTRQLDRIP
ncbi:MAG: hypothetical protein Pars2KO_27670 [Parasphingorhabdus sp.]